MKYHLSKFAFLLGLISLFVLNSKQKLNAQQVEILVLSKEDSSPIPFAHICLENLKTKDKKYQVTDADGKSYLTITDRTIFSASFVGYETIMDTILPSTQSKIYELKLNGFDIEEIVVTGQHKAVTSDQSIYKIKLIDDRLIEQKAANNLAELLSNELNINLSHDPSTGTGMKLQGISGENIKILIDGVPIIGRLDGNIDLSQIDMSNVDHIEIVEGPMSVIYGSNALAGVINIITKQNKYAKFKTNFTTYYESVGTYNANSNLSFKYKKSFFNLSAGRNFFSGFDTDTTSRRVEYKPKEQYNTSLNYAYTQANFNLKYKIDFFDESLLDRSNLISTPYSIKGFDTWFHTLRTNNSLQLEHKLSKKSSYNILAAYSFYTRERLKYQKDMTNLETQLTLGVGDHDTSSFNAIVARGVYNFTPEDGTFSVQSGFDINSEKGVGKRMKNGTENIQDYALFTGLIWDLHPNLSIQGGLRAAYNSKYKAPLVPSFNLKYNYKFINFRASYSRGFRAPSLKELYLFFFDSNHQIQGNEDLQAEYSHSFNISSGYKLNFEKTKIEFELKAYYNLIENMITLVQIDPENELYYSNENIGHYESIGGELNAKISFSHLINVDLGYSKLGRTDFYDENTFIYSNNFNSNLNVNLLKNTASISIFYKFIGEYPFYTNYDGVLSLNNLSSYHNMDITLSKNFNNKMFVLSGGVKNVFDNVELNGTTGAGEGHGTSSGISSLAGWGRTFFLGLKINLVKY